MTKIFATTLLGLSICTFGCVVGGGDTPGSNDQNILGGTDDPGDPSVVQYRFSQATAGGIGTSGCTATVISPTVLLTAAHCAPIGAFKLAYNPSPAADPFDANGAGWISVQRAVANPAYNGDAAAGHDVGILLLAAPTDIAASALGTAPAAGSSVRAVGYGRNEPQGGGGKFGGGVKRTVDITVSSVTDREFVAGVDLLGTCHGDSGGPVFQGGAIVGTTSYGTTADCRGAGHYMRLDDNRAFIDGAIAGGAGPAPGGGGGGGGDPTACINACDGDPDCIQACSN